VAFPGRPAFLVAVAAGALLALGAAARGQTPAPAAIVASDFAFAAAGGGAPDLTIATGGEVTFEYSSGASRHNVVFSGAQPASCQVSASPGGQVFGPRAPLPGSPYEAPWRGYCVFERAGAYPFVCGLHPGMRGSITVADPPGGPPPPHPTFLDALDIPAASSLRVARVQRGLGVRASLIAARAGSRCWRAVTLRRPAR
jgi:plastocyanin